jgi:hypothetical protein
MALSQKAVALLQTLPAPEPAARAAHRDQASEILFAPAAMAAPLKPVVVVVVVQPALRGLVQMAALAPAQ